MASKLKVTLVKSTIGSMPKHRKTIEALGLKGIGEVATHNDNDAIRGMIFKVKHLINVEEI